MYVPRACCPGDHRLRTVEQVLRDTHPIVDRLGDDRRGVLVVPSPVTTLKLQ
jgi:hypothetical protein